jgi:NADH-quinone oxidoreductase subunit M
MPRVAAGFLIGGLASLGLPGLNNFVAEFLIFIGSFTREQSLLGGVLSYRILSILAISGIVITATYVLRVVKNTFFGPRKPEWDHLEDARGVEMVPIVVLVATLILFGLLPSLQIDMINSGVAPLVAKIEAAKAIGGIF